jgi:D-beta-D-heptose 7-phosphate kinase / D-beta-D-heptose 1-phosphate adenosyltransferase
MMPFHKARVLVVGDVMLDQYLVGDVRRISPEAPVPVARIGSSHETLGGAANVAANVVGLGASCYLAGYLGHDSHRPVFLKLLARDGIHFVGTDTVKPTIAKVRVLGGNQQMIRLDYEEAGNYKLSEEDALLAQIRAALPDCGAVVLSDYGKGACSKRLCQTVIQLAAAQNIPVLVDPKTTDWERYQGACLVTPNLKEYNEVLGLQLPNEDVAIAAHAEGLRSRYRIEHLLVTRSERGMTLFGDKNIFHMHTEAQEVFDVSGAGDTVIGTLATALSVDLPLEKAVALANSAAGIVVGKAGTVPINWLELQALLRKREGGESKIMDSASLREIIAAEQAAGHAIVFTNGCFDILHRGHLTYLRAARALGKRLVVGLNSDASVQKLKGPTRPVNAQQDRALMMAALEFVDYVVIFGEDTPERLLSELRPDILVKGGDYRPETVLGSEFVREVRILPFVDGYSTTTTIAKINAQ